MGQVKTGYVRLIGAGILFFVFQVIVALLIWDSQPADWAYWSWWLYAQWKLVKMLLSGIGLGALVVLATFGLNLLITDGERDNNRGMY